MAREKGIVELDTIRRILSTQGCSVHFIGIGGISMYTLARLLLSRGYHVSGSDRAVNARTKDLTLRGVGVYIGHDPSGASGADLVVYSNAISSVNTELVGALRRGIPTVSRAELMGALMLDYKSRIGVSGTHGKSTTVAMLDTIFAVAMTHPTTLSGAELTHGEPIRIGDGAVLLYEACEYCDSFLHFTPTISVALNLELDHTDYFKDISSLRNSFCKAMSKASSFSLLNIDDENLLSIMPNVKGRVVTFGQNERADYRYLVTGFMSGAMEITVYHHGTKRMTFTLRLAGAHNAQDAAAAIAVSLEYGLPDEIVKAALESFRGVPRRLEYVGSHFGRPVFYDYAHHPTEIVAGINTLKMLTHDFLTVVFKPHTFTRTASLWSEFSAALSLADHIVLTDIYPAREQQIPGINSKRLADDIGERAIYCADYEVLSCVDAYTQGAIVVMGAGELEDIKNQLISK